MEGENDRKHGKRGMAAAATAAATAAAPIERKTKISAVRY